MEQKKKKDKSVLKKISSKLSREQDPDNLVLDTLGELKGIVSSMRGIFEDFEDGYSKQLDEERGMMQKLESKLPKALQSSATKNQMKRMDRIKGNKSNLGELEDNLSKLELVLSSSTSSLESLSQAYVDTHAVTSKSKDKSIEELEAKMESMQENITDAMSEMTAQISLIKTALDNMAGQLDEQGVALEGIDGKIDTLDSKLDQAHEMLKKISKQITGNRLIMLAVFAGAAAFIAQGMMT
ncbi:MAG: hypothetical protein ACXAE3_01420 [Candidatus Kariarchaeaceae archaeon]|jgi:chromosome segregation ATPase